MLIPDLRGRVTILDKDNKLIVHLGDNPNVSQRANNGVKKEDTRARRISAVHTAQRGTRPGISMWPNGCRMGG